MTIHLNKVNGFGGGAGGGGGDGKFPTIVTDSGSSLPIDLTGYNEGDTFLNTSDKRLYTAQVGGYALNTSVVQQANVIFDTTTGVASNFNSVTTQYYTQVNGIFRGGTSVAWEGSGATLKIHFKLNSLPESEKKYILLCSARSTSGSPGITYLTEIRIKGGKLNLGLSTSQQGVTEILSTDICETVLEVDTEYYLEVVKNGTSANVTLSTGGYGTNVIETNTVATQDNVEDTQLTSQQIKIGASYAGASGGKPFSIGSVYLYDTTGELAIADTSSLLWDSGTSLTDKTEYADKTNGILYLYQDTELVNIPQKNTLSFTNVSASSWVADSTYADYGYKCELSCSGVTSSMFAQVIFAPTEADSGNYATVCLTGDGTVTIYSKVNDTITIPSIVVMGV